MFVARRQCFFVWRWDISIDGFGSPRAAPLLLNAVTQFGVEAAQSLSSCLWWEVIERRPIMAVQLLCVRGWTLIVTIVTMVVWCFCMTTLAPATVGRVTHSGASWLFLTPAVTGRFTNMTTLCTRFPEATSFAVAHSCASPIET